MKSTLYRDVFSALLILLHLAAPLAAADAEQQVKAEASAIQILNVEAGEVRLPPEFQMALYENLIEEVRKTGRFQHVYRDGEHAATDAAHLVTLRSTVGAFQEGSARKRQVTTVAGATSIKVHVRFTARDGEILAERDLEGKVRFFGENLRATHDFAKKAAKLVRENF